jgi:hypothetical protein
MIRANIEENREANMARFFEWAELRHCQRGGVATLRGVGGHGAHGNKGGTSA